MHERIKYLRRCPAKIGYNVVYLQVYCYIFKAIKLDLKCTHIYVVLRSNDPFTVRVAWVRSWKIRRFYDGSFIVKKHGSSSLITGYSCAVLS